jgi:hypothetical protein
MKTKLDRFQSQTATFSACEKPTFFSHEDLRSIRRVVFHPHTVGKNKLSFFFKHAQHLSDDAYWYALRLAYQMSVVHKSDLGHLYRVFAGPCTRYAMMEKKEVDTFSALPDFITLYKVLTAKQWQSGFHDYSWYLDKQRALYPCTPRKLPQPKAACQLYGLTVSKYNVIALLNNKSQQELLLNTHELKGMNTTHCA